MLRIVNGDAHTPRRPPGAPRRVLGGLACAIVIAAAAPLLAAAPAPAPPPAAATQTPPGNAQGMFHASNAPIDITADQSELFQQERRQVWKGDVEAIQGQDRLRTPQLTVFYAQRQGPPPAAGEANNAQGFNIGKLERMEAEGPVYYITPTQDAKGDHATYLASNDTITMIGNVVLVQDKNVVTGDKLVIEQKTGHSTLISNTKSKPDRVRAVIYQQNQAQPASPGQPAKPAPAAAKPPAPLPAKGKPKRP